MASSMQEVLVCMLLCALHLSSASVEESVAFTTLCTDAANCTTFHDTAVCDVVEGAADESVKRCACDVSLNYGKYGENACAQQIALSDICMPPEAVCVTAGAECRNDGSLGGQQRCQCMEGRQPCQVNGVYECGEIITSYDDATCQPCERNSGTCVDVNDDGKRDRCECPASRSGDNCQNIHANVTCSMGRMRVCYLPHPNFNFSNDAVLYVNGYGDKVQCLGEAADDECGTGRYVVTLSLEEDNLEDCGTWTFNYEQNKVRYENKLMVQQHAGVSNSESDLLFKVYCTFNNYVNSGFLGLDSFGVEDGSTSMHLMPNVVFDVLTSLREPLASDDTVRDGDKLIFSITVDGDSGYDSLRVEYCTFRPSVIPSHNAKQIQVIVGGCPAPDQNLFTSANKFRPVLVGDDAGILWETGLVPLPLLGGSSTVFLHCSIKICIKEMKGECEPMSCGDGSRKKRSLAQALEEVRVVTITKQINMETHTELFGFSVSSEVPLMVALGLLLLSMLVIALILCALLARHRNNKIRHAKAKHVIFNQLHVGGITQHVKRMEETRMNGLERQSHNHYRPYIPSSRLSNTSMYDQQAKEQLGLQESVVAPVDTIHTVAGSIGKDSSSGQTLNTHAVSDSSVEQENRQNEAVHNVTHPPRQNLQPPAPGRQPNNVTQQATQQNSQCNQSDQQQHENKEQIKPPDQHPHPQRTGAGSVYPDNIIHCEDFGEHCGPLRSTIGAKSPLYEEATVHSLYDKPLGNRFSSAV